MPFTTEFLEVARTEKTAHMEILIGGTCFST